MSDILLVLVGATLVNSFVLTQFLRLCPFTGTSSRVPTAVGMTVAITVVVTLATVSAHLVYHTLLAPFDLVFLRTIAYMLVIAVIVTLTAVAMHRISPALYRVLGLLVPLITANCAVFGVVLLSNRQVTSVADAVLHGVGTGLGFSLALVLFAALRERLAVSDVPTPFQGPAIVLITAGLMALAFMGLDGLV